MEKISAEMSQEKPIGIGPMEKRPFFSIIIPVYNVAPYLRECLDSVLAQTFKDWEAICVDDGSTDGSGEILDEYAEKDARIRVLHQGNAGVSAARNRGLEEAKGEWVCFLDGDDVWHDRLLSIGQSAINIYPNELLFRFNYEQFVSDPWCTVRLDHTPKIAILDYSKELTVDDILHHYFCCFIYNRNLLNGIRFPGYKRGEDWCFLNEIKLFKVNAIVAIDAALYGYRRRMGSAVNQEPDMQMLMDELKHRWDVIRMIEHSYKKVSSRGDWWFEKYFTDFCGIIYARKSRQERKQLWSAWFRGIRWMKDLKWISLQTRAIYLICYLFPFEPVWKLICYVRPRIKEIVKSHIE